MSREKVIRKANMKSTVLLLAVLFFSLFLAKETYSSAATQLEQSVNETNNIANAGQNITLIAGWTGEDHRILFCKDVACTNCWYSSQLSSSETSGCWCYDLSLVSSPFYCRYTTSDSDSFSNNFYFRMYNVSDVLAASGQINSGGATENAFFVNHRPMINSIYDNSNSTNRTAVGSNVTFSIDWSDSDGQGARVFVCNTSAINETGCNLTSKMFCNSSNSLTNPATCRYAMTTSDPANQNYYVGVCDNRSFCSEDVLSGTIYRIGNDTTSPVINISLINNVTYLENQTIRFIVTDDINISNTSINMNISVGISNWIFNFTNMSCSGNDTILTCDITINKDDGLYNLTLSAADMSGNPASVKIGYVVDARIGSIAIVRDGYYQNGPHIANITTTRMLFSNWTALTNAESDVDHYEYAVGTASTYPNSGWDSMLSWTNNNYTNVTINLSLVPDAAYYFHIRAITRAGLTSNVSSSDGIVYVDPSPPVCFGGSGSGGCVRFDDEWTNSLSALQFIMNFTENGSEIIKYQYAIGSTSYPQPGFDSVKAITNSSLPDVNEIGLSLTYNHSYVVSAKAQSSNSLWSDWYYSANITVDSVAPQGGSINYTSRNITTNQTTIGVNSGIDLLSGIRTAELQQAEVQLDPGQGCTGFSGYENYNITHDLSSYSTYSFTVTLSHGYCYRFRYLVTDYAGNTQVYTFSDEIAFYVDLTPPQNFTVIINNGDAVTHDRDMVIDWTDSSDTESGIAYYSYTLRDNHGGVVSEWVNTSSTFVNMNNITYANGSELIHEFSYYAIVRAYNSLGSYTEKTSNSIIYLDNTPPAPAIILNIGNDTNASDGYRISYSGEINISLAGENGMSCVYSLYDIDYSEYYGTACSMNNNISVCNITVEQGNHTYYVLCKDAYGNRQMSGQGTRVSWISDQAGPNITILNPDPNEVVAGIVNMTASIVDAGIGVINSTWFTITNLSGALVTQGSLSNTNSTYYYLWNSAAITPARYTLTVSAGDSLGYETTTTVNFTLNNDVPYLEITAPAYSSSSNSWFNITFMAQIFTNLSYNITNSSRALMRSNANNTNSSINRNYLSWTESINISNSSLWRDGFRYNITAVAINNRTNTTTKQASFIVDRYAPTFSNVSDTSGTYYNNESVQLSIYWNDTNGISSVNISVDGLINFTGLTLNGTVYVVTISPSLLQNNRTYNWRSSATDIAGRVNSTPDYSFTITNRPPFAAQQSQNISSDKNSLIELVLIDTFSDVDNDNLTFNYTNSAHLSVLSINELGEVQINITPDWTGSEIVILNATDPYRAMNFTMLNITVSDFPPNFTGFIQGLNWLVNTISTIDLSAYFYDGADTLIYNHTQPSLSNISVSIDANGIATLSPDSGWTGTEWIIFNASDTTSSILSNNLTLQVSLSLLNSTIIGSTINGVYYENNITNAVPSFVNATLNTSTVTGSTVINSTIVNSTVNSSQVRNSTISDSYVDPSIVLDSIISDGSNIISSNITGSTISSSDVNYSAVMNSSLYDTTVINANITNGVILSGLLLASNGSYYNASLSGAENLSEIMNYPPLSLIGGISLGRVNEASLFTVGSTDVNINGTGYSTINDSLSYNWFFQDGTNQTTVYVTVSHAYSAAGTYTVTLVTSDAFGRSSNASSVITVTAYDGGGGGGGGSGGGIIQHTPVANYSEPEPEPRTVQLSSSGTGVTISKNGTDSSVRFIYAGDYYTLTLKGLGDDYANIQISSESASTLNTKLIKNQLQEFDINDDDVNEISIAMQDYGDSSKAYLIIKQLVQPVKEEPPVVEQPEQPSEIMPPAEEQPTVIEKPKSSIWMWIITALVVGGLIAFIVIKQQRIPISLHRRASGSRGESSMQEVVFQEKPSGLSEPPFAHQEQKISESEMSAVPATPAISEMQSQAKPVDEPAEMDEFILTELKSGRTLSDIINVLEANGWSYASAYDAVAEFVIRQSLKAGYSPSQVHRLMLDRGWDEETVVRIVDSKLKR